LGLSICKKLTELMGGKMWFESKEGKGSTFYFTIMTLKPEQPIMRPIPHILYGKRVLIIDKSTALQQVLSVRMYSWGITSVSFKTVREAISVFGTSTTKLVDLFLVDARHGLNEIHLLKAYDIPIVLMGTTKPSTEFETFAFLNKPIRISKLLNVLEQVLQNISNNLYSEMSKKRALDSSDPLPAQRNLRILIAEDNFMNQKVIVKVLESAGYTNIEIVEDGLQALEIMKRKTFEVILMDCMMPKMDGLEATERIRAECPLAAQPVIIALTANAFPENRRRCFLAGMNFVLTKPLQKKELIDALHQFSLTLKR